MLGGVQGYMLGLLEVESWEVLINVSLRSLRNGPVSHSLTQELSDGKARDRTEKEEEPGLV